LKYETKLKLNLQLVEEKKHDVLLQAELTHAREMSKIAGSEELPTLLLVDVGDTPVDVMNVDTLYAPSRQEYGLFTTQFMTTTSSVTTLAGRTHSSFASGERLCQTNTIPRSCATQYNLLLAPVLTPSSNLTQTHSNNSSSASHVLWPTVTTLLHAGTQNQTDLHLQPANHNGASQNTVVSMNFVSPLIDTIANSPAQGRNPVVNQQTTNTIQPITHKLL